MNKLLKDLKFTAIGSFLEKAGENTGRRIIKGHASTSDLDRQGEIITLGALIGAKDDLLKSPTVFLNHSHNELPVGRVIATEVDQKGLIVTVEFTKAQFAEGLWKLIEEGIINKFSIGGRVLQAEEKRDKSGNIFNEITKISLMEVSIVGLPANNEAKFELVSKSFNSAIAEELEKREVNKDMSKEKELEVKEEIVEIKKPIGKESVNIDQKIAEAKKAVEKAEEISEENVEEVIESINEDIEKDHTNSATDESNMHWHEAAIDENGKGETTTIITKEGYTGNANHVHKIVEGNVVSSDGHTHEIHASNDINANIETETDKSEDIIEEEKSSVESVNEIVIENEKEVKILEEKSTDEKILELLGKLIENTTNKPEIKEEVIEDVIEEINEEGLAITTSLDISSEKTIDTLELEKIKEVPLTGDINESDIINSEKAHKNIIKETVEKSKKIKEDLQKQEDVIEKIKEIKETKEDKLEDAVRKGEIVIAEAPYGKENEPKKLTELQLKELKNKQWSKILFGK